MRKLLFIMTAALLTASCGKEIPVTKDHPVSAEFEAAEKASSLAVIWASCPTGGDALNPAVSASGADVALCLTDLSFEGGADDWFSSHASKWPCAKHTLGIAAGEKYLFAAAGEGVELSSLASGNLQALLIRKGKFAIILGAPSEADIALLLQETWFKETDSDWIYALRLSDESPALEDATFADCLAGQFGPVAMAGSRSDYLYTSAGIWSLLRNMSMQPLDGGMLYGFTILAEESRL